MANKKFKGFSLAELLIALLVISIVLAAAIPTMTRKGKASEQVWRWSIDVPPADRDPDTGLGTPAFRTNSTFFGTGVNQSVFIGSQGDPLGYAGVSEYFPASEFGIKSDDDLRFTTLGDKLAITKVGLYVDPVENKTTQQLTHFMNSHIAFYNLKDNNATQNQFVYVGRIAMDQHNMAMGLGALQSTLSENAEKIITGNTALGHYSLFWNQTGMFNTAVGNHALSRNRIGNENTAVGHQALSWMYKDTIELSNGEKEYKSERNTGIGAYALQWNEGGNDNTAVGSNALANSLFNSYSNTAIGSSACNRLYGNNNICIGSGAGSLYFPKNAPLEERRLDISVEAGRQKYLEPVSNKIEIGADNTTNYSGLANGHVGGAPLIEGISSYTFENIKEGEKYSNKGAPNLILPTKDDNNEGKSTRDWQDKQLGINAKYFELRPYNGGTNPIFRATLDFGRLSEKGTYNGYANNPAMLKEEPIRGTFEYVLSSGMVSNDEVFSGLTLYNYNTEIGDVGIFTRPWKKNAHPSYMPTLSGSYFAEPVSPINLNNQLHIGFSNTNKREEYPNVVIRPMTLTEASAKNERFGLVINGDPAPNGKGMDLYFSNLEGDYSVALSAVNILNNTRYNPFYIKDSKINLNAPLNNVSHNLYSAITIDQDGVKIQNSTNKTLLHVNPTEDTVLFEELKEFVPNGSLLDSLNKLKEDLMNYADQRVSSYHSDIRLKNVSGDSTAGLKEINALEVKNYTYKADKTKTPHVGVIAQQLQKVFPNSVFEDKDGFLKIKTEEIFYAMVNSIKELSAKVQDLTAKVVGLDKRITELEKQNKELKKQNEEFEKRLEKLEKVLK